MNGQPATFSSSSRLPGAVASGIETSATRILAFRLFLLFVGCWFIHVSERVGFLGVIRFDLLLLASICGLMLTLESNSKPALIPKLILGIAAYTVVTIPFVQWPGSVVSAGLPNFIKAIVFYFFTVQLVTTESQLKKLLTVFVLGQTFRVMEPLYLNQTQGYWGSFTTMMGDNGIEFMERLAGSPFDVINGNGLAAVIVTVVPFLHFLGPLTWIGTVIYLLYLPLGLYTLTLTASRSGLLALAMTVAFMWRHSKRKAIFGLLIVIAVAVGVQQSSADLYDRYLSIFSSNTKNAATAAGRTRGMYDDFEVALRRPVFGHGIGTSLEANANFGAGAAVSHNLYTEVAQELGFLGLALFLVLQVTVTRSVAKTLSALKLRESSSDFLVRFSMALQAWLWMNLFFSFASYGLSSYEWYFIAGLSEVLRRLALQETAPAEAAATLPAATEEVFIHPMLRPKPNAVMTSLPR
jgi:putative inorganic carbon (HCO3(-)) transporter